MPGHPAGGDDQGTRRLTPDPDRSPTMPEWPLRAAAVLAVAAAIAAPVAVPAAEAAPAAPPAAVATAAVSAAAVVVVPGARSLPC
ncbi:hypothetical protein GCM10010215_59160 [Streptomyces virginiae]|nr:hypothetical protein GCM10010215_59160 [Streptomyces virginiae]